MVMVFDKYAEYYDLLYREKDYEGECDFVEAILRMYSERNWNVCVVARNMGRGR